MVVMRIYLSARYARGCGPDADLPAYAASLQQRGHTITARWLDGSTFTDIREHAEVDRDDVAASDVLVAFSEEPLEHSPHAFASRGGRHVEVGIAIGCNMCPERQPIKILIVGPHENVFGHLADARVDTWDEALAVIDDWSAL